MYLLDSEITVRWQILPSDIIIDREDLDLLITSPDGSTHYLASAILPQNYTPYSATSPGLAKYKITPNVEGKWVMSLVIGDKSSYQVLSQVDIFVFDRVYSTPEYRVGNVIAAPPVRLAVVGKYFVLGPTAPDGQRVAYSSALMPIGYGTELSGTISLSTLGTYESVIDTFAVVAGVSVTAAVTATPSDFVFTENYIPVGRSSTVVESVSVTASMTATLSDFVFTEHYIPVARAYDVSEEVAVTAAMTAVPSDFVFTEHYIPIGISHTVTENVAVTAAMTATPSDFVFTEN